MNDVTSFTESTNLQTISEEQIKKINKRLPEFHEKKGLIGHSTSQASYSLQTLQMINDSPLSRMKQCLAQINRRYNALEQTYYKVEKMKLDIIDLSKRQDEQSKLRIRKLNAQINSMSSLMENSLRQLGMFQDMYDSIKKNNNIPDNWTEKDFEKQEISHMIKSSFRIAIQDLMATGSVSRAAVEYWEQLGIHPHVGRNHTIQYLENMNSRIGEGEEITVESMYNFLDNMAEKFKDSHRLALKRMGLDELGSEEFMAAGHTKPT